MAIRCLLALSLLYVLISGTSTRRDFRVLETRSSALAGYISRGTASLDTILNLLLALVRNDDAGLIDALYAVSIPSSPNYGNHVTKGAVRVHELLVIGF